MHALDVTFTPRLRKSADLWPLAERAAAWLTETVGESLDAVAAEWDVTAGTRGRDWLGLRMTDFAGSASAAIDPAEFADPGDVKAHLRATFRNLLSNRIHTLIERWSSPAGEGDGDASPDE